MAVRHDDERVIIIIHMILAGRDERRLERVRLSVESWLDQFQQLALVFLKESKSKECDENGNNEDHAYKSERESDWKSGLESGGRGLLGAKVPDCPGFWLDGRGGLMRSKASIKGVLSWLWTLTRKREREMNADWIMNDFSRFELPSWRFLGVHWHLREGSHLKVVRRLASITNMWGSDVIVPSETLEEISTMVKEGEILNIRSWKSKREGHVHLSTHDYLAQIIKCLPMPQ